MVDLSGQQAVISLNPAAQGTTFDPLMSELGLVDVNGNTVYISVTKATQPDNIWHFCIGKQCAE